MKDAKLTSAIHCKSKKNQNRCLHRLKPLCTEIRKAFPWAALALIIPAQAEVIVVPGEDISNYLDAGYYELSLIDDTNWHSNFNVNTAAKSNITIFGNNQTIIAGTSRNRLLDILVDSDVTITDATITNAPFAESRQSMLRLGSSGINVNLNFNNTAFVGIGPRNAGINGGPEDYGPIISHRQENSTLNINGGTEGLLFLENWGTSDQPGTIGIDYGTANFLGNIIFDTNWTGNYGGAVTLYEHSNATMNFNGNTFFINNHSSVHGGAINIYGNNSKANFNGDTTFDGNYVYGIIGNSLDFPVHVTDQNSSGGAINIGYIDTGANSAIATFSGNSRFTNNAVIDTKNNSTNGAFGGAISLQSRGENRNYYLYLNGPSAIFEDNFAYSVYGNGFGGAIYVDTSQSANISGGTTFTNNYAKTAGGAIYVRRGALNFNADTGDIIFEGNRQQATFTTYSQQLANAIYNFYTPDLGSGIPNAIYWLANNTLTLEGTQGNAIRFYDPLATTNNITLTVNQTGDVETIFYGDNGATTNYDSDIIANTTVNGGTFTLADSVNYGRTTNGTFNLNAGTLKGNNSGTLSAAAINLNNGSSLAVEGGTLTLNSSAIALGNTANSVINLTGYGTLNSTSNLNAANSGTIFAANIDTDASANPYSLTLQAIVAGTTALTKAGAGTLIIPTAQAYSGGTAINQGTVIINSDGTLSTGAVSIANAGTLSIESPNSGNYALSNALSGDGLLQVSLAAPTNTFDFAASAGSAFAGIAALNNSTFNLSGNNTAALTNATLQLNGGNTTTVGAGVQNIGNLTMSGGTLQFTNLPTGYISTDALILNSGVIQVDSNISDVVAIPLLQQDDSSANQTLIAATSVTGQVANLTLQDLAGNPITNAQSNIVQGGNTVAVGSYNAGLTANNTGLYLGYLLTQLNLLADQTLTLSGDTATPDGAADMKAVITGAGNLAITATNTITLNNAGNNYTGSTTVNTGTLRLGSDNALGNTSLLDINSAASVDVNGAVQTIGALSGAGTLNVNNGNLSINNGGTFSGVMAGTSGGLNINGGTLTLTGDNTYSGNTTIATGAQMAIGNGGATGSYTGNIINGGNVNFNRSNNVTYAGIISGDGTLTQSGSGTLILTGDNTYSGDTTIAGGILQIGNGGTSGSITGNIIDNGTLTFNRSDNLTYAGAISGTGDLIKEGTGTLTLAGTNSYNGITTINAGRLIAGLGVASLGNNDIIIDPNGELEINQATDATLNNDISGGGLFYKTGSGILTLASLDPNSSIGTINVQEGGLNVANGSKLTAVIDFNLGDATLYLTPGADIYAGDDFRASANSTIVASLTPNQTHSVISSAYAYLAGNLVLNGYTPVAEGKASELENARYRLIESSTNMEGDFSSTTLVDAESPVDYLTLTSDIRILENMWEGESYFYTVGLELTWLAGQALGNGVFTLSDAIDDFEVDVALDNQTGPFVSGWDGQSLTKNGVGTLLLSAENGYTGTTTVNGGTLQMGIDDAIATSSAVSLAAGTTLDLNNFNQITQNLTGDGTVTLGTATLTVQTTADTTFNGAINGAGNLAKTGANTLILTGANNYQGTTTIDSGILQIGNGGTTGNISNGNVLNNGALSFNLSNNYDYAGIISGSGILNQNGTGTTTLTGANTYSGGTNINAGRLILTGDGALGSGSVNIAPATTLQINAPNSGNYNFTNALTGSGLLQVALASATDTFDFNASTGSVFAGEVELNNSTFNLDGVNTSALTNATLKLNGGNTTTVGAGSQAIGNLTMSGGTLSFANLPGGTISTNALTLGSGDIRIAPTDTVNPTGSLLLQDEGIDTLLINAATLTGSADNLTLNDLAGNALTTNIADIEQNSAVVARGTYSYALNTNNDNLNVSYRLTELDLQTGQTLTLDGDAATPNGAADMKAQIIGVGNLAINATNAITLNNAANNYTGSTTVNAGTLVLGSNNALGNTSLLNINAGATTDVNGATQTIGALGGTGTLSVNNGSLSVTNGGTFAGVITGSSGNLNVNGSALTLTGDNTYTGNTNVASGAQLAIGNGGTSGNYVGNINNDGSVNFNRSDSATYAGIISGSGTLAQNGSGTLILTGDNIYSGDTLINSGTLQIGDGGTTGNVAGNIVDNGILSFNRSDNIIINNIISGTGNLIQSGTGTLTLAGVNSYSGGTNINSGSIILTNASAAGSNAIGINSGTSLGLNFDNSSFANTINGTNGSIVNVNGSNIALTASNTGFSGIWNINGSANVSAEPNLGSGSVTLNGALNVQPTAAAFTFANALSGNGVMNVNMANAADAFAFGSAVGTGFNGTLALNNSAFSLSGDNTTALTNATLQLNGGNTTTVGAGPQAIGNLSFNGGNLIFSGSLPPGTSVDGVVNVQNLALDGGQIQVDVPSDVANPAPPSGLNLLAQDDGNILAQLISAAGAINGSISNLTLTDLNGNPINAAQTLAVTESGTNVANATYNFGLTTGNNNDGVYFNYGLTQLELISGQTLHLIADAGATGNASTLTALLTGAGNVDIDASTSGGQNITLNNVNNNYQGATTVSGGTLTLGSNNALGNTSLLNINAGATTDVNGATQTVGALGGAGTLSVNNGSLSVTNGGTFAGVITGSSGNLNVNGSALTLTGSNTYTGNTNVASGAQLAIGNGGTSGNYVGNINNDGSVNFNRSDSATYAGIISGSGTLAQNGSGTLILTGDNIYSGDTLINSGTLQIGNGGASGSVTSNIINNSDLAFNRSNELTIAQTISGSGTVEQNGTGTLIVTGSLAHTGGTTVNAGTLQIGDNGTSGSVAGNILNDSVVSFNRSDAYGVDGIVSGSGTLQQNGSGTTTLTALNSYTGSTVVNNGTLRLTDNGTIGSGNAIINGAGNLLIDVPTSGDYLFNNALSGNGQLIANLSSANNTFDFSSAVGTAFAGTFTLAQGTVNLSGDNVTSLTNATLNLGTNGVAILNSNQTIGNLAFSGGQFDVSMTSPNTADTLTVNYLNVDVAGAPAIPGTVNLNNSTLLSGTQPSGNLLLQGNLDTNTGIQVVAANSVSTVGKQLSLLLDNTQPIDQTYIINDGFGNSDVRATYGYGAVATDNYAGDAGLYVGYLLKILDSQSNVVLDSTGAPNTSFGVLLTGMGNFEFRANNDSITLVNAANDYSGETTVSSGALRLGTNGALGQTSMLNIAPLANVDINGFTQTIGALNAEANSTLNLNNGNLTITDGGVSNGNLIGGGQLTVAGGILAINNANTALNASTAINNGATVQLANAAGLGSGNVDLNGTLDFNNAAGTFANGLSGNGTAQLSNGSDISFSGNNSAYSGVIDIDSGNVLTVSEAINLGNSVINNDGSLVLNTDNSWTFTNAMNGNGSLTKAGTGTIGINSDYAHSGGTTVQAGTLALLSDSAALSGGGPITIAENATLGGYGTVNGEVTNLGTIAVGSALTLPADYSSNNLSPQNSMVNMLTATRAVDSTLALNDSYNAAGNLTLQGNLINRGNILLAGTTVGNTLTINGNYDGGGNLLINTVLGGDNSLTDKLIVNGDTSGQTSVTVNNVGGAGAQTYNGIQIVEVDGASNGTFSLLGRVVAGAYDYNLYQGSVDNPGDGNWYLRLLAQPEPQPEPEPGPGPQPEPEPEPGPGPTPTAPIRPEVGAYMANQDAAINMFTHSLHDRFGDSQFISGNYANEEPSAWGRIIGNYTRDRVADQIKQKRWGTTVQLGGDLYRNNAEQNSWNIGIMGGYGTARSKNSSDYQSFVAHSDVRGYSVGLYGTWFANGYEGSEGAYLDAWTQYGWYHNEVKGDLLAEQSYRSRTAAVSLEGGWTFKVSENESTSLFVQPQAQAIYVHYSGRDFYEDNGTFVQNPNNDGVITRVGVRFYGKHKTESEQRWQPFVETNWLYNDTPARVTMNGESFDSGSAKNRVELKTGVEGQLNNNWQLWGNVGVQKGDGDYKSAQGIVGVKYSW